MTTVLDDPAAKRQEIELKYAVPDEPALRAWLEAAFHEGGALSGIETGPWSMRHDEDVYIDTEDGALHAAGYGARLRRRGSDVTLTVKSVGRDATEGSAALVKRLELEAPASQSLDPSEWPESEPKELITRLADGKALRMRFVLQQRRAVRQLRSAEGAKAELSLDRVRVRDRDRVAGTFTTLEVEGIDDAGPLLERVASELDKSGVVEAEPRSKDELARVLVQSSAPAAKTDPQDPGSTEPPTEASIAGETEAPPVAAPKAPKLPKTPGVRVDDTLGLAGRKVLGLHLERMLAAEAGTRSGEDPEDLHKMRVATRRMRAAWRVFDGAYRPKLQRRYVRELREVAGALGAVRDLDVQLDAVQVYADTLPALGAAAMGPLAREFHERRDEARKRLAALLDSDAYADFVADYRDFVATPGAGEVTPLPGTPILVRDTAAGRIWHAYERVRAHDTILPWADVPALHALRIDAKRLRYTLESFRDVLPPQADGLVARTTELQDHLGNLNDADLAARLTREVLVGHAARLAPGTREAMGHYLDSREAEVARLRRLLPPVWRRMVGVPFRRTLAFAVATI